MDFLRFLSEIVERQILHHPFHFHEARSLNQHCRACCQADIKCLEQRLDVVEMRGAGTEGETAIASQIAQGEYDIDAASVGVAAYFLVKAPSIVTDFAHIA